MVSTTSIKQVSRDKARAELRELVIAWATDADTHLATYILELGPERVGAKSRCLCPGCGGPLVAVKLNILTRKTLGGFETDLDARVFGNDGNIIQGLYAVGEAAGFGGGGVHGYRALEGTFLGGCLFSGRNAGRAAARAVA